jgi:uncharacterized protein (DUF2147 family)
MKYIIAIISLLTTLTSSAQTKADDVVGVWLTAGKEPAKIQVYRSANKYYGKIVWLKFPEKDGKPRMDSKNPEKNKQSQQVIGLMILQHFKFDDDEWTDGDIYDPESGKTYSCTISLKEKNVLKVRGYVGISLLGRTEIWNRSSL